MRIWGRACEKSADRQHQHNSGGSGKRSRLQPRSESFPPGRTPGNLSSFFDEPLGFELGAQRNPDAIRRSDLSGKRLGCGDDGLEIGDESLANATRGQVKASIFGKLPESLGFEYEFQFFTVHTRNSRGRSTGRLSLETYPANFAHRVYGVFSSF